MCVLYVCGCYVQLDWETKLVGMCVFPCIVRAFNTQKICNFAEDKEIHHCAINKIS